jgi:hypothetical protein
VRRSPPNKPLSCQSAADGRLQLNGKAFGGREAVKVDPRSYRVILWV